MYNLYRLSLAQLDLQRQVAYEGGVSTYPSSALCETIPSRFRNIIKCNPDNLKVLVYILENYGRFKVNNTDYVSVVPERRRDPLFVTFKKLPELVEFLELTGEEGIPERRAFFEHNSLPGAEVDEATWTLTNGDSIWPRDYSQASLQLDALAVKTMLENMKTKFEQVAERVTYSGVGKIGQLMSCQLTPAVKIQYVKRSPEMVSTRAGLRDRPPGMAGRPLERSIGDFKFILDSGATDHFIFEPCWFTTLHKLSQPKLVGTANPMDKSMFATGWGTIRIPTNTGNG